MNGVNYIWRDGALVKKETLQRWRKIQQAKTRADVEQVAALSNLNLGDHDFDAIVKSPLEVKNFIARCRERIPELTKLTKKQRASIEKTLARLENHAKSSSANMNPLDNFEKN